MGVGRNEPPGSIGFRFGLILGLAIDPLLPRVAMPVALVVRVIPVLAALLPLPDFLTPMLSSPSWVSVGEFAGMSPVESLPVRFMMLAGVTGAMFGLTEVDPDALKVVEDDADEMDVLASGTVFVAGGAGGGMERSTGEGVSLLATRNGDGPVPFTTGVEVREEVEVEGPLRPEYETEGRTFGDARLRTPSWSSPLLDTARLSRVWRCCTCWGRACCPPCCCGWVDVTGWSHGLVRGERSSAGLGNGKGAVVGKARAAGAEKEGFTFW